MLDKPDSCLGCVLFDKSQGFSLTEGTGEIPLLVVAEALGEREAQDGLPLRPKAQAGSVFQRLLRSFRIQRDDDNPVPLILSNILRCRPPGNRLLGESYESEAIKYCRQYLDKVVADTKPKAIFAMGGIALAALTGMRGKKQGISDLRGYPIKSIYNIPVVATLHPAFISRGQWGFFPAMMNDFNTALKLAKGKLLFKGRTGYDYMRGTTKSLEDLYKWLVAHPLSSLMYDIETPMSSTKEEDVYDEITKAVEPIISIQFSIRPGHGIFVPMVEEFIPLIRLILATPNPKANHNTWAFDNRKLRRNGFVIGGDIDDTLAMWHHLQPDLPRGLGFVASFYDFPFPWKYLSADDPEFYGCADPDAVQHIWEKLVGDLKIMNLWDGYVTYVKGVRPILDKMEDRGIYLDPIAKAKFRDEVVTERDTINSQIQAACPAPVKSIHPKEGYKVWPKEAKAAKAQWDSLADSNDPIMMNGEEVGTLEELIELSTNLKFKRFGKDLRPYREEPFLPNSSDQLKRYCLHFGIPVPKDLDGDETTAKDELTKLIVKLRRTKQSQQMECASFLESCITYRELNKIAATYIDGWAVDDQDRTHTTFTYTPATGQLGSKDPNVQNAPKHSALGKKWRQCMSATPGHTLIEADWKSFHALTLGFFAEDPDYMQLAREDCHSFFAAHLLHLPEADLLMSMSSTDRLAYFKWLKSDKERKFVRDKKAKPTILGMGFGLGAAKLYKMNDQSFKNEKEAQAVIDMFFRLFPRIKDYQNRIRKEAESRSYLRSPWGFIRRFYDVSHYDAKKEGPVPGEDAESCIAFLPANGAFGKVREAMLDIAAEGLDDKYWMVNNVHDSLVFDCPNALVSEAVIAIKSIMERPASKLVHKTLAPKGLVCEVEISTGPNWGELTEVKF